MKALTKLPRFRLNIDSLLAAADCEADVLTYSSDIRSTAYAASPDRLLIITGVKGYLDIKSENLGTLIEELQFIREEMDRRR